MHPERLPPFVYLHNNYTYRLKLGFYAAPSNPKVFSKSVRNELDKLKYSYNSDLKGLVMGFGRISSNQVIPADFRHNINVSVNVDVYIFRPSIGSVIEAVVNQVSESHVGCLVLELFNVSIVRPENKPYRCWQGSKVKKDDKINVRILSFDTTKKLPHITGEIVSDSDNLLNDSGAASESEGVTRELVSFSDNLLSDSGAASESEADFFSTKATSKEASESDTERDAEVIMKTSCPNSSSSSPLHYNCTQNVSGSEHSVNSLSATRHKRFEQMQKHLVKKKTASMLQSQAFIKPSEQEDDQAKFVSPTKSPVKTAKSSEKARKSAINDSYKTTNTSLNFSINNDSPKRETPDSKKKKTHRESTNPTNSPSVLTKLNLSGTNITDNSSSSSSSSSSSDEENASIMKSLSDSRTKQESKNRTPRNSTIPYLDSAKKENPSTSAERLDSSSSDEHETVKTTSGEKLQTKTTSDSNGSDDSSDDEMFESLKINQSKKEKNQSLCNKPIQTNNVLEKKTHQDSTNLTNSPSALTKLNRSGTGITDNSSSSDEENLSIMKSVVNKSPTESKTKRESMNKTPTNSNIAQSLSGEKGQTKTIGDTHRNNDDDSSFESLKTNKAKKEIAETLYKPLQIYNKVTFKQQTSSSSSSSSEDEEKGSPAKRQTDKLANQSPVSEKTIDKTDGKNIMESPLKIKSKQKKRLTLSERSKCNRDAAKDDSSSSDDEGGLGFFKSLLSTSTPRYVDGVKKDDNVSNVVSDSEDTAMTSTKNDNAQTTITKHQPKAKCNSSSSESSDNEMYKSLKMIIAKNPRQTPGDSKKIVTINNVTFCDTSSSSEEDEKQLKLPQQNIKRDSCFSPKAVVDLKDGTNENLSSTKFLDEEKSGKNKLSKIKRSSLKTSDDEETNIKVVNNSNSDDEESVQSMDQIGKTAASPHKHYEGKRKKCFKLPVDLMSKKSKHRSSVKKEHVLLNQIMNDRPDDEMDKTNTGKKANDMVSSKRTVTINNEMFQGPCSKDDKVPNTDSNCLDGNKIPIAIENDPVEIDGQDVVDGKNKKKKSKKKDKRQVSLESPLMEKVVKCSPKSSSSVTTKAGSTKHNTRDEIINLLTLSANDSNSEDDDLLKSINEMLKRAKQEKTKKNSRVSEDTTTPIGTLKRLSSKPTGVLPKTDNDLIDNSSEDETCKSKKKKKTKIKERQNLSSSVTFHASSEDETTMLLTKSLLSKSVPVKNNSRTVPAEENKRTDTSKKKKKKIKDIKNVTVDKTLHGHSPSIKPQHSEKIQEKNTKVAINEEMSSSSSGSEDEMELLQRSLVNKLSHKSPTKILAAKKVDKPSTNDEEIVKNKIIHIASTTTKTTKKKKSKQNKNLVMAVESPSSSKNKTVQEKLIEKITKEQSDSSSSSSEDENKLIAKSLQSKCPTRNAIADNVSVKTAGKQPSDVTEPTETTNSSSRKTKIKKTTSNKMEVESDHNNSGLIKKQKPSKRSTQAEIIKKLCQDSSSEEDERSLIDKILKETTKRSKKEKKVSKVPSKSTGDDKDLSGSKITKAVPSKSLSGKISEDDKTHKSPKQKRKSQKFKFTNLTSHRDSSSSEDEHDMLIKSIMLNKSLPPTTSLKTKKSVDKKNDSLISDKGNFSPDENVTDDRSKKKKNKINTGSPSSLKVAPGNVGQKSPTPKSLYVTGKKHQRVELIEQITQPKTNSNGKKRPLPQSDSEEISKKKKKKM